MEERIISIYNNLTEKEQINEAIIPYENMRNKIATLFNSKKDIIDYEDCINYVPRKRRKK